MCFIEWQHYSHCNHYEPYFHDCWNEARKEYRPLESKDHDKPESEIHTFDRPCPPCLQRGARAVTDSAGRNFDTGQGGRHSTALSIMRKAQDLDESGSALFRFRGNVDFDQAPFYGKRPDPCKEDFIDHEAALREDRGAFLNTPRCKPPPNQLPERTEPTLQVTGQNILAKCSPEVNTDTVEVLVHFNGCGHVNTLFCPRLEPWVHDLEDLQNDTEQPVDDFVAPCDCDGFDSFLGVEQYAESENDCLVCQLSLQGWSPKRVEYFRRCVRSCIEEQDWEEWSLDFRKYARNDIFEDQWMAWPEHQRDHTEFAWTPSGSNNEETEDEEDVEEDVEEGDDDEMS